MAATLAALLAIPLVAAGHGHAVHRTAVIGRSVDGRAIHVVESGTPGQPRILVVGCIHGNECAGMAVIRALRRRPPPTHADLWLVPTLNPDGRAAGTRQNAHGVDLNRNFAAGWTRHGTPGSTYYSGPRPFSEPETQAARRLVTAIRPKVTIWYHQHMRLVWTSGKSVPAGPHVRDDGRPAAVRAPLARRGGVGVDPRPVPAPATPSRSSSRRGGSRAAASAGTSSAVLAMAGV